MEFMLTANKAAPISVSTGNHNGYRSKEKVVVIMGTTGAGKSRLSIDLATRFPGEIINSDKIQVYKGLNIATNKISREEQLGVPHHLLGEVGSPSCGELTAEDFRSCASKLISEIVGRGKVPYIVGGSNSFIYALLIERFSPNSNMFSELEAVSTELRYDCCFLWVDVSTPVLNEYLKKRVDEMVNSGMVDELENYYESEVGEIPPNFGLSKCIGVPEFQRYFKAKNADDYVQHQLYKEAVKAIKDNTCDLANAQLGKIKKLRGGGWGLHRLDGTNAYRAVLEGSQSFSEIWEKNVLKPSLKLIKSFLER